jgi:hypothetical protein
MSEEAGRRRSQAAEHDHMINPLHVNPHYLTATTQHHNQRPRFTSSFQKFPTIPNFGLGTDFNQGQCNVSADETIEQPTDLLSWPTILPTVNSYFDTTPFTGGYFPRPLTEHDHISESSYNESDCFTNHTGSFSTVWTTSGSSQPEVREQNYETEERVSPQTERCKKLKTSTRGDGILTPIKTRKAKSKKSGRPRASALEEAFKSYSETPTFQGLRQLMEEAMSYGEIHSTAMSTFSTNTPSASEVTAKSKGVQGLLVAVDDISSTSDTGNPYNVSSESLASEAMTEVPLSSDTSLRFTCTFHNCDQAFAAYSDWKRHEENQDHYPQERFMCLKCLIPNEMEVQNTYCETCLYRFCMTDDMEAHYRLCLPLQDNPKFTFTRKYHLNSHLRRQHNVSMAKANELSGHWKYALGNNWPRDCHICHIRFRTWDERMKHIAKHFHRGEGRPPGFDGSRDDESDDDEDDQNDDGPPRKRFRSNTKFRVSTTEEQSTSTRDRDTHLASHYTSRTKCASNFYYSSIEYSPLGFELERLELLRKSLTKENTPCDQHWMNLRPKTAHKPLALPHQCLNWDRLFILDRYLNNEDEGMQSGWNWSDVADSGGLTTPPLPPSLPRRSDKHPKRTVKIRASFQAEQLKAAIDYLAQHVRTLPNGVFWFNSKIKQDVKDSFWDIAIQAVQASPKDNPTVLHVCDSWWIQEGATMAPTTAIDCTHLVIAAYQEADIVHLELTLDKAWEKLDIQDEVQDLQGLRALFNLYIEKSRAVLSGAWQEYSAAQIYTKSTRQFIDFLIRYKRPFNRKLTTKALAVFLEVETAMLNFSNQWTQTYLEKECQRRRLLYLRKSVLRLLSVCYLQV